MIEGQDLRELYVQYGPKEGQKVSHSAFFQKLMEMADRKERPLHLSANPAYDDMGVSLRQLWYATTGREYLDESAGGLREDINSTAFSVVTGNLMQRRFIEAYEAVPKVGPRLVTNYPSRLKIETLTGFTRFSFKKRDVNEGTAYPQSPAFTDKYVTAIDPPKRGELVSVTKETIHFDATGEILSECARLGESLAENKEWRIVGGVLDLFYTTAPVYYPSGSAAELYPTNNSNANYVSGANTRINLTNGVEAIQTARNAFVDMYDDSGDDGVILNAPTQILCADKEADIVNVLMRSPGDPTSGNLRSNPLDDARHRYEVLSTQWLDWFRAKRATYTRMPQYGWGMGNFPRQFIYKEVFPLTTAIQGAGSDADFDADLVFRFKASEKGGVFARDTKYCVFVKGEA